MACGVLPVSNHRLFLPASTFYHAGGLLKEHSHGSLEIDVWPKTMNGCLKPARPSSTRVLSNQWQGEFCRCSIDVIGGKQCDDGVDHLERFRHHTGRKRANQWRKRLLTRSIATVSSLPI